jgi:signal transduction histidine kinase
MRIRFGISAALVLGFGSLLFLIVLLGVGVLRQSDEMERQMLEAQREFEATDKAVSGLPADIHLAGTLVRDFVLDPSPAAASSYKELLAREQQTIEKHIRRLATLRSSQPETVDRLQRETQAYADSLDPMLAWSHPEKLARSHDFIQRVLIPRRQAVLTLARELSELNEQNYVLARQARERSQEALKRFIRQSLAACVLLGSLVAALTFWRVHALEMHIRRQHERAAQAEREQHRLARRVVEAQEEERRRIALELHDAVGQMASAVGMELGRLESTARTAPQSFPAAIAEVKQMNTEVVRAIKEIAAGLRPALLDDLGLAAAIRAHSRDVSRRLDLPIDLDVDPGIDFLPEPQRTCLYRIVQESLHNCGRHARATRVSVSLSARPGAVSVLVRDDGVGFDPANVSHSGLGLIGIRERVRDLGGQSSISSSPGAGTSVEAELPIPDSSAP